MIDRFISKYHFIYARLFLRPPYCIDCKNEMYLKAWIEPIATTNDELPKKVCYQFRCKDCDYEIWMFKDGSYTSFYASEG